MIMHCIVQCMVQCIYGTMRGAMHSAINRVVHSAENSVDKYFLIDTQVLSTQFPSESQVFSVHQSGAQVVSKLSPSSHQ